MYRSSRRLRFRPLIGILLTGLFLLAVFSLSWDWIRSTLFDLTGEERLFSQIKGLTDLTADLLRPRLHLGPDAPVQNADLNPYGINVFLNEEADPAKREESVRLAAEAGFHWLRQEFPWQDIEIHGKGDFEDRRNKPSRSAWEKYDQIVDLADKYGMELIVRVSTPPAWSRKAGESVGSFAPPDDYEDFGDFVHTLVSRYRGRIRYYQIWNEPNIYPEWGSYSISPEDYTRLLKIAATRARDADPNVMIISGALASTIALQPDAPPPSNALNDLLFLQRMYDAGAAPYFDVMAMQAYGLWSGPSDRRMHPRVMNFGRPQFVRDLMVANGDADKPIWISEMGWNAVPDNVVDKRFGQVSLEQQARYEPMAYQRAQEEWPWAGVVNTWYLKRATDEWAKLGRPEAYFRLADPDFTLQSVYHSLKDHITGHDPVVYPGSSSPRHWAITTEGPWADVAAADAPFGFVRQSARAGARLAFSFEGTSLSVVPGCRPPSGQGTSARICGGRLKVVIDDLPAVGIGMADPQAVAGQDVLVAQNLTGGPHRAVIEVLEARAGIAAIAVEKEQPRWLWYFLGAFMAVVVSAVAAVALARGLSKRRRSGRAGSRPYTAPKVFPRPKPKPPSLPDAGGPSRPWHTGQGTP